MRSNIGTLVDRLRDHPIYWQGLRREDWKEPGWAVLRKYFGSVTYGRWDTKVLEKIACVAGQELGEE